MQGIPAPPPIPPAPAQAGQQGHQQQQDHPTPHAQGQQILHLNWCHLKQAFLEKPDEDAEAHLLFTDDWMNTHQFVEGVKFQRLCFTLLGEARLWYHSLGPINIDWIGLQNLFRQQYSEVGNAREHFFHAWRSIIFDKITETIDAYVTCIRQVAALLGYRK